jgi:hypothetical protein
MCGGGTDGTPTFTANWFSTDATYKWHIACGGAAEFYSFNAFAALSGTITLQHGIFMDVLATGSFPTSDVDPCVAYCSTIASSNSYNVQTVFAQLGGLQSNVTNPALARAWMGAVSQAGASTTSNSVNLGMTPYGSSSSNVMGGAASIGTNAFSLKDDMLPAWYMRPSTSTAPTGVKGCSTLFSFGSVIRQTLDTADVLSTRDRIYVGSTGQGCQIWAPWSGALVSV